MIFLHGRSAVKRKRGSCILLIVWEQRLAFSECSNIERLCYTAPQKTPSFPSEKQQWSVWMFSLNECQWQLHTYVSFMSKDSALHSKLSSQITPLPQEILNTEVFWALLQKRLNQSEERHNINHRSLLFESRFHFELQIENFNLSFIWHAFI